MGGSMIQLLAYGAQDVYITGSPQVTYFKAIYKRYSNFAMEFYKNNINDAPNNGSTLRIPVTRYGDLIGQMFFELPVNMSILANYTTTGSTPDVCWLSERAFSSIELQIGNITIDKHYKHWWRIYSEVFMDNNTRNKYDKLTTCLAPSSTTTPQVVYLPLHFFFNRNPGLFIPLIALQFHEVNIIATCSPDYNTFFNTAIRPILWVNYVLLDADERRRFSSTPHEYLIEQVQHSKEVVPPNNGRIRVKLSNPVKELIWMYPNQATTYNSHWDYSVYPNFVELTNNPQVASTDPHKVGCPAFSANNIPWTEEGDIVYNTTPSNISPVFSYGYTLGDLFSGNYVNVNLKSNVISNNIPCFLITSSDAITYTLSNGSKTITNTIAALTTGAKSNASVLTDFTTKLQTSMTAITNTQLFPYVFANTIVSVPDSNQLITGLGKVMINISNIWHTTANLQYANVLTLSFGGAGATKLGYIASKVYSNTLATQRVQDAVTVYMYGFSNTTGAAYLTAANITSTNQINPGYSIGSGTLPSNYGTIPAAGVTLTSASSSLGIDLLSATGTYTRYTNVLPSVTMTISQLASNLQIGVSNILAQGSAGAPGTRVNQPTFANATVTVSSTDLSTTISGIVTPTTLVTSAPFILDDYNTTVNYNPTCSPAPLQSLKTYFNGQERFTHDAKFLNQMQPYYHNDGNPYPGIYCYSFGLKPGEYAPSGTCNFSRIDSFEIVPTMKPVPTGSVTNNNLQYLYAVNYNILRIQGGMAGLAFV